MRLLSLAIICFLAALLAVMHWLGLSEGFLWKFWWYDILLHTLGGLIIGCVYLWTARHPVFRILRIPTGFPYLFLSVLAVGILWEVFEYFVGLYPADLHPALHELDTVLDIAFDMTGATIAYMAFTRLFPHNG